MDPIFLIEIVIVSVIIAAQIWVFAKNSQAIQAMAKLIPNADLIRVILRGNAGNGQPVYQIQGPPSSSQRFVEIASHSNSYLEKNPGAVRFTPLKEIAVGRTDTLAEAIEANLPLPLYIGLLCTFTGVIIGLVKIAFVGVTDAAIQGFIGGVLIGMIGSAAGLAMTTRSNFAYKNAKQEKDEKLEGYLELLRREAVAQESSPSTGIQGLREQLAAFHEGFSQYQTYVNQSLGDTVRLFRDLKDAFQQIQAVEQGLQGIGRSLQANDSLITRQEQFLQSYVQRAEQMSQRMSERLQEVEQKSHATIDAQLQHLESSNQSAFVKMDQYLASIADGDRKVAGERLAGDLQKIKQEVGVMQAKSLELNQQLATALQLSHQRESMLGAEIQGLRKAFESGRMGGFTDTVAFRIFAIAGTLASLLAIAGGSVYLLQTYGLV